MKKLLIVLMMVSMLAGIFVNGLKAENKPASKYGELYNGCELIEGATNSYSSGYRKLSYFYSDGYFRDSSKEYNTHLSTMSFTLTLTAMEDSAYSLTLLAELGFKNNKTVTTTTGSVIVLGNKTLYAKENDECVLIPIAIEHAETVDNYDNYVELGNSGDDLAAANEAEAMYNAITTYITENNLSAKNLKFWVMGYSIGAGTGDILSKKLSDIYSKDKVFGYLFEPIQLAGGQGIGTYENIHCVCNSNNALVSLLPTNQGFSYYGVAVYYGDNTAASFSTQEQKMLAQLNLINGDTNDYVSANTFTYAQIYFSLGISTLASTISSLSEGKIFTFVDTNHKYGNSPKAFWSFAMDRIKASMLTCREDYTTNVPDDVKKAAENLSGTSITMQQAIKLVLEIVSTLTDAQYEAFGESFKNFNYTDVGNIKTIVQLFNFLTKMEIPTFGSYKSLVSSVWNLLNTSDGDYKAISKILTTEQTTKAKKAMSILLYRVAQFVSKDWAEEKQVIGTIGYNINYISQTVKPSYNLAWVRSYDSYYENEDMMPIVTDSNNIVEFMISAPLTAIESLTIEIMDGQNNIAITDKTNLFNKAFIHKNDEYIAISYPLNSGYKLKLTSIDALEKIKIKTRLYNVSVSDETEELYLYTGQIGYISCDSSGKLVLSKDIVVTTTNCAYEVSDDKQTITFTTDVDYCQFDWIIDGKKDSTKTDDNFEFEVNYDTANIAVSFDYTAHNYGTWINEIAADCGADGTKGHYNCSLCDKNFDKDKKLLDDLTISALAHDYQFSEFVWNGYTAKAKLVCSNNSKHTDEVDVNMSDEVTTSPTCTSGGEKVYTATYLTYSDEKKEQLSALNHDYQFSEFVWTNYTAQAKYICSHDSKHVENYNASMSNEITTNATCTVAGVKTYTATYKDHTDTKDENLGLNPNKHALTHYARLEAKRSENGHIEYWQCDDCENYFADAQGVNTLTEEEIVIDKSTVTINSIAMKSNPTKMVYVLDEEEMDLTGAVIELTLSNGTYEEVTINEEMVTGFDTSQVVDELAITVTYEGFETSFNIKIREKYLLGDVNDDGLVTDADAIQILMHTFFAEQYPINQPCDFYKDDQLTDADAIYLLMYTFFPNEYPLG